MSATRKHSNFILRNKIPVQREIAVCLADHIFCNEEHVPQCSCVQNLILDSSTLRWEDSENHRTEPVSVCVSPWSVSSDGPKRVEAGSRGNGSGRQNVWNAAGRVKTRARIPRPQRVDYHPATATRSLERKEEKRRAVNVDSVFSFTDFFS